MNISYDVTSRAKLKYIISCLSFGFKDNFIGRGCLMIDMQQSEKKSFAILVLYKLYFTAHVALLSRVFFPYTVTHPHISVSKSLNLIK